MSTSENNLILKLEGAQQEVFVREGLSIGRASSNIFQLADSGVEHIHARVVRDPQGAYVMRPESPTAALLDGNGVQRNAVSLRDGTRFRIGSAVFVCQQLNAQPVHDAALRSAPEAVPSVSGTGKQPCCPVCLGDISTLSREARQCPACGRAIFHLEIQNAGFTGWLPGQVGNFTLTSFLENGPVGIQVVGNIANATPSVIALPSYGQADSALAARIPESIRVLPALSHPGLLKVTAAGCDVRMAWMTTEWVGGKSMAEILTDQNAKRQYIPAPDLVLMASRIADGVEYLHSAGIGHGNLSLKNILYGADNQIRLRFYGLPRLPVSSPGDAVFASPEQPGDTAGRLAADVYSFGAVLHQLLTLGAPVNPLASTAQIRPDCATALHSLIAACLLSEPARRPKAADIAAGLRTVMQDPSRDCFAEFLRQAPPEPPPAAAISPEQYDAYSDDDEEEEEEEEDGDEEEGSGEEKAPRGGRGKNARTQSQGKGAAAKRKKNRKKSSRRLLLGILGMFVLAGLVVAGGVMYNLTVAPSIAKVDDLMKKGDRGAAKAMLRTMAETHNDTQAMARLGEMHWQEEEYPQAVRFLKTPADENVALAQTLMGEMILSGKINGFQAGQGVEYLRNGARENTFAQYLLGMGYYEGNFVEQDKKTAFLLLDKAASAGESRAEVMLGKLYLAGEEGVQPNVEKGLVFLESAARRGDLEANEILALIYVYGQGVKQDFDKASGYVKASLDKKSETARELFVYMSYFGRGMPRERNKAFEMAEDILEDDADSSMANYVLGYAYIFGDPIDKNPTRGIIHLETAVRQNNPFAIFDLGEILYSGRYGPQDFLKAYELFTAAGAMGNAEAHRYLGIYHYIGIKPVERDHKLAYEYLRKAEMNKDIDAEAMLGVLCIERHASDEEEKEGWEIVQRTERLGSDTAKVFLGKIHITGAGVEKDLDKAIAYLEKPALKNPDGRCWMGRARYEKGDMSGAYNDFLLSAEQNVPEAHLFLGKMLYNGQHAARNYKEAMIHLIRSGAAMDGEAQAMLAKINYYGLAGNRDYVAARRYMENLPANDDELSFIRATLLYYGLGGEAENKSEGWAVFEALADTGYHPALVEMGVILYDGVGTPKDMNRAKRLFEQAALADEPRAFFMLGRLYHEGVAADRNDGQALDNLNQAVAYDVMEAKAMLGAMMLTGDGVEHDVVVGIDLLTEASRFGILDAQLLLGGLYLGDSASGIKRDPNLSASHVEKSAEEGNEQARILYGAAIADPAFMPAPRPEEALVFLEPAADAGDALALRVLGEICFRGQIPEQYHPNSAVRYFTPAAEKGDLAAARYLARMYREGNGVPRDPEMAVEYLRRITADDDVENLWRLADLYTELGAGREDRVYEVMTLIAETGNSEALYRLGVMYEKGIGTGIDAREAFRRYSRAEQGGNKKACAPLGEMYFLGEVVERDYNRAAQLLYRGEEFLSSAGSAMLGWMSYFGIGTERSNASALKHLELGIAAKEPLAAVALAKIYLDGEIVIENYGRAFDYARMSLPVGQPVSRYVLGRLYGEGLGIAKDFDKGIAYLTEAADQGYVDAMYYLGKLHGTMSGTDKEHAGNARKYLKMAMERGHPDAEALLDDLPIYIAR